jgi:peptide/nickel transport system ATP-binding protein
MDVCRVEVPPLQGEGEAGHLSACHLPLSDKERIFSEEVAVS